MWPHITRLPNGKLASLHIFPHTVAHSSHDPRCSGVLLLSAVMRDARARMLVARTVSRAESLTLRCSVLAISQMLVKEHSSSGIVANSGEVSDSACSRPAAAILDARARMLATRILSRAASLTLRCSVLICRR